MKISAREKRFLVAGGLSVLLYLAAAYGIEPFVSTQLRVREEIGNQTKLLERYQLQASERDRYHQKVEALRLQFHERKAEHFTGDKLPVVAAEIQGLLHRLGQEAGVTFVRQNVPPPKKVEMFTQVIVDLSVRGELRAVRDFLYNIQSGPKLLAVPRLLIRGSALRGQTGLTVDLQVVGFVVDSPDTASMASPAGKNGEARGGLEEGLI